LSLSGLKFEKKYYKKQAFNNKTLQNQAMELKLRFQVQVPTTVNELTLSA